MRITDDKATPLPLPARRQPIPGVTIAPPARLTLFNGSPRGKRGNTPLMLGEFARGFGEAESRCTSSSSIKQHEAFVQAFAEAECAWIGFPLYTDGMPGSVKRFFEALRPLVGREGNPPLGFLVQSGFSEALHSRYVERYLASWRSGWAARTWERSSRAAAKASGCMPPQATRPLFENLQALGAGLRVTGAWMRRCLARIAQPERFPAALAPIFRLFLKLPAANGYFNNMLKKNGAYERRFARPFGG